MSEPNLALSSLSAVGRHADETDTLDTGAANTIAQSDTPPSPATEPLKHYLDVDVSAHASVSALDTNSFDALAKPTTADLQQHGAQEQASLYAELKQARSQAQEQTERIRHLEQALDQSLVSLSDMRRQVVDQQLLEAQLASTEDISNIQQQAIARLKLQLTQQQQILDAQRSETRARDRALQELLTTMEALTQAQQSELDHLRTQIAYDRVEVQAYQQRLEEQLEYLQTDLDRQQARTSALELQSLDARTLAEHLTQRLEQAHRQVSALSQILTERQIALEQLESELQQAHAALYEQQALIDRLQQARRPTAAADLASTDAHTVSSNAALTQPTAQGKLTALEAQLAKQTTTQAMLQHACQELESERDRQQARIAALENQTTDMQEQILRQAQQSSEYEAAIQHWKDRCLRSQSGVLKLKQLLEQALPDPSAELLAVLAALLEATDERTATDSPDSRTTFHLGDASKVDLPDFLLRRRNYKTRRS